MISGKLPLLHVEQELGGGQIDVVAVFIHRHFRHLEPLEFRDFLFVSGQPAGLVEALRNKGGFGAVLVLEAVLNDFELQLADRTHHLAVARIHDKKLGHPFVGQLLNALFQLLGFHRVIILQLLENLGREAGNPLELQVFALGQRVANFEVARIVEAHDISGVGFVPRPLWKRP